MYEPSTDNSKLIRSSTHYTYVELLALYNSLEGAGSFSTVTIDGIDTIPGSETRYIPMGNIYYIVDAVDA